MANLGIDFGTANSCAAVVFDIDSKKPITIEPSDGPYNGDLVFPSYVAFNRNGEVSAVGLPARERFFKPGQSDLVVRHFKRLIGRPYEYVIERIQKGDRAFIEFKNRIKKTEDGTILLTVGNKDISVVEVTSYLLNKIVEDAQIFVQNRGEIINSVTMSIPTGLDLQQRQATLEAARLAGLEADKIQLVEEPTAAAIARGLSGIEGETIVINVGAGTTDVIIGYLSSNNGNLQVLMPNQDCDDLLGGMDMDDEIRKYVYKVGEGLTQNNNILDNLDPDDHRRLMGKIEDAKISSSQDGNSTISTRFLNGRQINVALNEKALSDIVRPILYGYETSENRIKGVLPVINKALLKAAGGNPTSIPKVINQIQWLIIIGGPCRMKCLHDMLKDIFKDNKIIGTQIDNLEQSVKYIKEGVAHGAALYNKPGLDVVSSVPWTVGILHQSGFTPIIHAGTPYSNGLGIQGGVDFPVFQGSNHFWIVSQKGSQPDIGNWNMSSHIANVPQEGRLRINLMWDVDGSKISKLNIQGCGLPEGSIIEFPNIETEPLRKELEGRFNWYITRAKELRQMIEIAREPILRLLISRGWTVSDAETRANELLEVTGEELSQADSIDIESEQHLEDEDLNIAIESGHFAMRKQVAIKRGLLTDASAKALEATLSVLLDRTPTTSEELINEANKLLNLSRDCSSCIQYWQQLTQWLHRLELSHADSAIASATVTSLAALADCLYGQSVITEEEYYRIHGICWRFNDEG